MTMAVSGAPLVLVDESSGVRYIKGKENVLFDTGIRISRKDYDGIPRTGRTLMSLMHEAAKNPANCGWDFDAAVKTKELRRLPAAREELGPATQAAPSILPDPTLRKAIKDRAGVEWVNNGTVPVIPTSTAPVAGTAPIVESAKEKEKVGRVKAFFKAPHTDIILMLVAIALLCITMSVYHTYSFLVLSGKSHIVAFVASLAMALYSASAFTAARHVHSDDGIGIVTRTLFSLFLVLTGSFVIVFSVFSTTNVSYDQFEIRLTEKKMVAVESDEDVQAQRELLSSVDAEIARLDSDIERYEERLADAYKEMNKPVPEISNAEDEAQRSVDNRNRARVLDERYLARKDYTAIEKQLIAAKEERKAFVSQKATKIEEHAKEQKVAVAERKDAYDLVSSILGIERDTISFVIYVIPSAFFDVVAPFAFAVALMLNDRRNGKVLKRKPTVFGNIARALLSKIGTRITGGTNGNDAR